MVFLYIIQSETDKGFYTGICRNIEKRLQKHNSDSLNSTKKRRPFVLQYIEEYPDYHSARLREKEIKSYKGGNNFKKLFR